VLGKERIILLAIEDITERRELEEVHSKKEAVEQIRKARTALGATIQAISVIVETRDPYTRAINGGWLIWLVLLQQK